MNVFTNPKVYFSSKLCIYNKNGLSLIHFLILFCALIILGGTIGKAGQSCKHTTRFSDLRFVPMSIGVGIPDCKPSHNSNAHSYPMGAASTCGRVASQSLHHSPW